MAIRSSYITKCARFPYSQKTMVINDRVFTRRARRVIGGFRVLSIFDGFSSPPTK